MAITPQFEEYYDPLTSSMQRRRVSSTSGPRRGSPNDPRRTGAPGASPRAGAPRPPSFNDAINTTNNNNSNYVPPVNLTPNVVGNANVSNMDGAYVTALGQMIAEARRAGHTITIGDGWRDHNTQRRAYETWSATGNNLAGNPVPAMGRPGRSRHEIGLAADLAADTSAGMDWMHANAPRFGIEFDIASEPWHAVYTGTPTRTTSSGSPVPGWDTYTGTTPQAGNHRWAGGGSGSTGAGGSGGTGGASADGGMGMAATTGDTSGNAVLASANNFDGTVPKDLVILNIAGQQPVIGYDMGNGVWGIWDGPSVSMVNGVRAVNVTAQAWSTLRTVRLGDVSELDDLAGSYGTFKEFLDEWLFVSGVDAASLSDPTVAETFLKTIGDPGLLDQPGVIERMLQESEWFQSRSSRALQWNDGSLSRAQKAQMIDDEIANVKSEVFRYLGQNMSFDDPKLREWGELIASGQSTLSKIINNEIKPMAQGEADSPWSRTLRDEERAQAQRGISYEDEAARIRSSASRWGVTLSEDELLDWGKKITENIYSRDDLAEFLKDTAQALYPWKAREVETATAAQPYLQAFNSTFETTGTDVFSPEIQSVMQRGVSVTDFAQELRNTDRWLTTENGRDEILSIGSQISRTMGFS